MSDYPRTDKGLTQTYTVCCKKADNRKHNNHPFVFVEVTGMFNNHVWALCEDHATPALNLLPVVS